MLLVDVVQAPQHLTDMAVLAPVVIGLLALLVLALRLRQLRARRLAAVERDRLTLIRPPAPRT